MPKSWVPLELPSVSGVMKSEARRKGAYFGLDGGFGGKSAGGGIAPADLAPYGQAGLSVALAIPPERLRRRAAEANPFDEMLLMPAEAARRLRKAVEQLSSLPHEDGPACREAEVRSWGDVRAVVLEC